MSESVFETVNITKKYHNTLALDRISMSIKQGEIYGFIGENGAGKTTMIRILTGLTEPTSGKIFLFGETGKSPYKPTQAYRVHCRESFCVFRYDCL